MKSSKSYPSVNLLWIVSGVIFATALGSGMLTALLLYDGTTYIGISLGEWIYSIFETFIILFLFGSFVSIAASIVLGGPMYYVARRLGILNRSTLICGGALIPCFCMIICEATGWNIPSIADVRGFSALIGLAFCGAIAGAISCRGFVKTS